MNIAIAAHDLYPDPGSGGSGRYVYETGRRLVDRGHTVSVLTRRRGDVPARETVAGMDVYRYDLEIADRSAPAIVRQLPRSIPRVAAHVDTLTSRTRPDVLSFQGPLTGPLLSAFADDSIPRVCTFHSGWSTEYRIRTRSNDQSAVRREVNARLRHAIERRLLGACDEVITLSAFMRDRLVRTYDGVQEPIVIPGGVDLERFTPDATLPVFTDGGADGDIEFTFENDLDRNVEADGSETTPTFHGDPAFLTVRRLSERMGHELLLEAFAIVSDRHPEARLYLAGDGPLRTRLERTAARLGIDDAVTFLGFVPDEHLPATYAASDCFVLPTTELEGFGLATLEALASGTPVVGMPVGATPEVVSGLTAFEAFRGPPIVSSVDADALAVAMCEWAVQSTAEWKTAGCVCRQYVERCYPWGRTVTRLEHCYRDLIY